MKYQHEDVTLIEMHPAIEDTTVRINEDGILLCPRCTPADGTYLHQLAYTIYERPSGEDGLSIAIDISSVDSVVHTVAKRNPSRRRQGLAILFECEQCGLAELTIYQHKGNTFSEWRSPTIEQMREHTTQEQLDAYRKARSITNKLELISVKR